MAVEKCMKQELIKDTDREILKGLWLKAVFSFRDSPGQL